MKKLVSGNEAVALGAYEAGVQVATGYPGLPSTEIISTLTQYNDIYTEWSTNEKVAMEVAIGASFSGVRTLIAMKDLGMNDAADPFFGVVGTRINGGLVVVVCDDSGRIVGDDMNDARHFPHMGEIPLLEPSSNEEAKEFTIKAFDISEAFQTPVFLRLTSTLTHSLGIINHLPSNRTHTSKGPDFTNHIYSARTVGSTIDSFGNTSKLRTATDKFYFDWKERLKELKKYSDETSLNTYELKDPSMGFVGSGVALLHAKEAYPEASFMTLGMSFPFPLKSFDDFYNNVDSIFIIEESAPIIEQYLKAQGYDVKGSDVFKRTSKPFHFTPTYIYDTLESVNSTPLEESVHLPMQLPVNCPGCPHRHLFFTLKKMNLTIMGDSGCYALHLFPPANAMDAFICMGSGVSMAHGAKKALDNDPKSDDLQIVSVIGDGVFYHTGINALMNLVYNQSTSTVVIADNQCIAMTGGQGNLGNGINAQGNNTFKAPIEDIVQAIGINNISIVDPYDLKTMEETLKRELLTPDISVIISRHPCLMKQKKKISSSYTVSSSCTGCHKCTQLGCLAIDRQASHLNRPAVSINPHLCTGCGLCSEVCNSNAITPLNEGESL